MTVMRSDFRARRSSGAIVLSLFMSLPCLPGHAAERAALGAELPGFEAPAGPPPHEAAPPGDEPRGAITLREAVAAALLRHPTLAADSWEVRSQEARELQAGALPNPEVSVEVENVGGQGDRADFEQTETTLWLWQLVELAGKRSKRRAVAEQRGELARWDYEARRLGVLTATTKAFVAVLAEQERLRRASDLEGLAEGSVGEMRRQLAAGAVSPVDVAQAEVVHAGAQLERGRVDRSLASRRAALAATWGSAAPRVTVLRGDLGDGVAAPPPLAGLVARLDANPDVARWGSELAEREAQLALARARRVPDPTLGIGGRHFSDNGDNALVFQVSLPLPVFDRNHGNVLAAGRDLARARAERAAAGLSVRTALVRRHADLAAAFDEAVVLRQRSIPSAERAFAGTRSGHRQGLFNGYDVLAAQRTLFDLRVREVDALLAYHHARADVERLVAAPLDEETP
jgi:cobalt-zinc-cadmium efflux system outer membrane protein